MARSLQKIPKLQTLKLMADGLTAIGSSCIYERPLQPVPGDCAYHPTTNKVKYVSRLEQRYLLYGLCNTTSRTKQSTYAEI
jgi:hypothetical protein